MGVDGREWADHESFDRWSSDQISRAEIPSIHASWRMLSRVGEVAKSCSSSIQRGRFGWT